VVAVWSAVRRLGRKKNFRGAVAAVRGFSCPPVHGLPGYQRPAGMASGHAPHTSHHGPARSAGFLTRCSPVRPIRVARSGTQIIYVRRILLGHSLPSPAGKTAPPPPVCTGTM